MLRTISPKRKNISIITNWGCRGKCWYCIWEQHPLKNVCLNTDWTKLESFLAKHQKLGKVSVSGGGDSLFRFEEKKDWWNRLFRLCKKYNLLIDVHTREKFVDDSFWVKINKVVMSCEDIEEDRDYFYYLLGLSRKLRITYVVHSKTSHKKINSFVAFAFANNCEFTFKQLVGHGESHYNRFYDIKKKFPNTYCLPYNDYNIYYMPNNKVQYKFI